MPRQREFSLAMLLVVTYGLVQYTHHCNWVTSEAYSSPSIVLISGSGDNRWGGGGGWRGFAAR
jgi:dolichyl-diphosphooligosaccharide--protein glycosyltransferase